MLEGLVQLAIVAWLPGAVLFRVPWLQREHRAALPAEERWFWQVVLSVTLALVVALGLGALGRYRFDYLLAALLVCTLLPVLVWKRALRYTPAAPGPGLALLIPVGLVVLCGSRFLPPSEYVIGGKDPGTYVNEGVQLAQRGSLVISDSVVAEVPAAFRDIFFPSHGRPDYYGSRFMGFFIQDPEAGAVVGQFPHLFPAALAVGYGIDGLTGVRRTTPLVATLGVLAVYLASSALFGRFAGMAAATLLALNVIQIWFAKYPNSEVMMQMFLFASVLALVRSQERDDTFFAALAGGLLGLLLFLRYDAVLAIGAITAGLLLGIFANGRVRPVFFISMALPMAVAVPYLIGPMRAYVSYPIAFVRNMPHWQHAILAAAGAALVVALVLSARRAGLRHWMTRWFPTLIAIALAVAAVYGLFFRHPGGRLAAEDAYALRTFATMYVTVPVILAAVLGYVIFARAAFWRAPYFYVLAAVFGFFFFYKIRVVQEYFWAARRFLPVILPATLTFASAAALGTAAAARPPFGLVHRVIGLAFIALVAAHYFRASAPVADHVEFADVIPRLEALAGHFGDDDLVLVESRDAGADTHVVGLPLAYIYARNVLVLSSARPDRPAFAAFLDWARTRYERIFFVGGAGTDLVSSSFGARRVNRDRFEVPEYQSVVNGYPRGPRSRKFDYSVYELVPSAGPAAFGHDVDIGTDDDLQVVRFQAKEESEGRSFRWTAERSVVTFDSLPPTARELVLVMADGGRPPAAPPAFVQVWLDDAYLGRPEVDGPFRSYTLPITADVAAAAAASDRPVELRLVTTLWNPAEVLGSGDDRELGVMVDRVTVR